MIVDNYYIAMLRIIECELKDKHVDTIISRKTKRYFANLNLFILDVYKIIDLMILYTKQNKCKKITFDEFKKILHEYDRNNKWNY